MCILVLLPLPSALQSLVEVVTYNISAAGSLRKWLVLAGLTAVTAVIIVLLVTGVLLPKQPSAPPPPSPTPAPQPPEDNYVTISDLRVGAIQRRRRTAKQRKPSKAACNPPSLHSAAFKSR